MREDPNKLAVQKPAYPTIVGIPISNVCDGGCGFCIKSRYTFDKDNRFMTPDSFAKLIENIKGRVPLLNISAGYGEALLHPLVNEFVEISHDNNVGVLLYTNGKRIDEHIQQLNVIDKVIVSANKSTLNFEKYSSVLANMNNITFSVLFDIEENDFDYLYQLCNYCHDNQMDIELRCVFNCMDVPLHKKEDVVCFINQIKKLESPYINIMPSVHYTYIHCMDPWRALYFDMRGFLRPCCVFYESISCLNVLSDDLIDIWNSSYMEKRREKFAHGIGDTYCLKCPSGYGNVKRYGYNS